MIIQPAERTKGVQEYYFSRKQKDLDAVSAERASKGLGPLINLGIGAPDGMPPQAAIDALAKTAALRDSHKYQNYKGLPVLRQAFADWYKRYYGVTLNPNGGIQPLVGSKEGILLISLAFVNPGDKVLVPDPGYPTYSSSAQLAGAEMVKYNLKAENGWFPDFDELENMDLNGVKLMWVNYPNMPTGASATPELYQKLVNFAKKHIQCLLRAVAETDFAENRVRRPRCEVLIPIPDFDCCYAPVSMIGELCQPGCLTLHDLKVMVVHHLNKKVMSILVAI